MRSTESRPLTRREFGGALTLAAAIALGERIRVVRAEGPPANDALDEALALLRSYGPASHVRFSNHAPMAAEALCALGRERAAVPWVER